MIFDIIDAAFEVTESLRWIHLNQLFDDLTSGFLNFLWERGYVNALTCVNIRTFIPNLTLKSRPFGYGNLSTNKLIFCTNTILHNIFR